MKILKGFLLILFFNLSLFSSDEIKMHKNMIEIKENLKELNLYKDQAIKDNKIEKEENERNKKLVVKHIAIGYNTSAFMSEVDIGRTLYSKCMGCHGGHGLKKALLYSKPIAKMTPKEIKKSILNYQKGIGGRYRLLMKNNVMDLREMNNIHILSNYIADLDER